MMSRMDLHSLRRQTVPGCIDYEVLAFHEAPAAAVHRIAQQNAVHRVGSQTSSRGDKCVRSRAQVGRGLPADASRFVDWELLSHRPCITGCFAFAYVGGFATEQEVLARWSEEIDHLGVFPEPSLVLRTARNDHNVARAADPLFAAEPELHPALEHPDNLLACVAVRLNMNALPDAPPDEHSLIP